MTNHLNMTDIAEENSNNFEKKEDNSLGDSADLAGLDDGLPYQNVYMLQLHDELPDNSLDDSADLAGLDDGSLHQNVYMLQMHD